MVHPLGDLVSRHPHIVRQIAAYDRIGSIVSNCLATLGALSGTNNLAAEIETERSGNL